VSILLLGRISRVHAVFAWQPVSYGEGFRCSGRSESLTVFTSWRSRVMQLFMYSVLCILTDRPELLIFGTLAVVYCNGCSRVLMAATH